MVALTVVTTAGQETRLVCIKLWRGIRVPMDVNNLETSSVADRTLLERHRSSRRHPKRRCLRYITLRVLTRNSNRECPGSHFRLAERVLRARAGRREQASLA